MDLQFKQRGDELTADDWNAVVRWAMLRRGGGGDGALCIGKLNGPLAVGGSAEVSVWTRSGSSFSDTNTDITVYDWLLKAGATALTATKKVVCAQIGGVWILIECECA